jgi:hypothetical protein
VVDAVAGGKAVAVLCDASAAHRPPLKTRPEEALEAEDRNKATVEPERQIALSPAPTPTMMNPTSHSSRKYHHEPASNGLKDSRAGGIADLSPGLQGRVSCLCTSHRNLLRGLGSGSEYCLARPPVSESIFGSRVRGCPRGFSRAMGDTLVPLLSLMQRHDEI